jgi:hypothetical protein
MSIAFYQLWMKVLTLIERDTRSLRSTYPPTTTIESSLDIDIPEGGDEGVDEKHEMMIIRTRRRMMLEDIDRFVEECDTR